MSNRSSLYVSATAPAGRPARWARAAALGFAITLASGCHSYVPTELGVVPEGEHVRLLVTRAGSEEVARVTDETELRPQIRGQFLGREDRELLVRIPISVNQAPEGMSRMDLGQVVRIPEGEVLTVDRREFSAAKTGALVGGTVAVAAFLLYNIFDVFSDGGGDGDPGPVLSVGFPIG